ncbi:hypothetical protein N7462_003325 [Penicillium macrosclerotiorum]|uniref:uncharacterized protein n=1 Tax=Penicillium macrosclerotiorum TaxID=303699 RepID=UPI0025482347|nr:uncharacterized protein N7462_003325 [Penicillium macrosclerotiorum]KAJ5688933.1 hypothetical protein N7462_003325 [Penicillium macrosclerotiorum]
MDEINLNKRYATAVVLPVLSSFAIVVCITPLILHAKNRNLPASSLIGWTIVLNLFNIINALIWPTDSVSSWWSGAGLCDIEIKIMVGSYVAYPGCLIGIFRGLAIVLDTSCATMVPTRSQRWRNRSIELLVCVVGPIIAMITHVVWQKSRYLLFAISGCVNNFDESWVSFVLAFMWPPILCLIAAYYCCLVLFRVHKYRSDFGFILRSANSKMSKSGFLRLLALACTMLLAILPVEGYVLYVNIKASLPWHRYSWAMMHGPRWDIIIKYPAQGVVFFDRWSPVAAGFLLFIFFGFGRDATRIYRTFFRCLGFGYCFPNALRLADSRTTAPSTTHNSATLVGTTVSRAKLLFNWKKRSSSGRHNGTISQFTSGSYDLEKGRSSYNPSGGSDTRKRRRIFSSLPFFRKKRSVRRHDEDTLLEDLSGPAPTVCTNAWAGTSQSRPSSEIPPEPSSTQHVDIIRVKQVLSQNSEVQI